MGNHTILLLQPNMSQSRTYYDFPEEAGAMNQIADLFEQKLAKQHPDAGRIQYRAEDLFKYIDSYKEFVALVFDPSSLQYQPHDKDWIKDKLIAHFSGGSGAPPPPPQKRQGNNNRRR
ncbi:enhancer of rudimentary [Backusella circina FSU 941]|nr:enhancer of rudimentary [Backusella circina FSU 941]